MPRIRRQAKHSTRFRDILQSAHRRSVWPRGARQALLIMIVPTVFALSGYLLHALAAQGNLDPAFGGGSGIMTTDIGGNDEAHAMALQPDGKIVLVGQTNSDGEPNHTKSARARYDQNGMPDTSFGNGGQMITSLQPANNGLAVAVQPDGKILTAGYGL